MVRIRTAVAVCLLLAGAAAMAGPTFGFATITGDRGVSVDTAGGEFAYLGLESIDESVDDRRDTATVARIHNNVDSGMALTTTVDTGPDLRVRDGGGFASSLAAGETTSLTLECDGGGGTGTETVTVTVVEANATDIVVEDATLTVDVDYHCRGGSGDPPPGGPPNGGNATDGENASTAPA